MKKQQLNVTDESRSPFMTIVLLAWPVFVEQIFSTLVSFADTAMVGSMGAEATASISISNSPIFLLNGIIMSLGVGLTALVARATGAGDTDLVKKLMRHTLLAILYIGLPIAIVTGLLHRLIPYWMGADENVLELASTYNLIVAFGRIFVLTSMILNSAFRGYGDTKTPMIANLVMNIVNVVGNYLLINPTHDVSILGLSITVPGAGWAVNGAAVATAIGMTTAGVITLYHAFKKSNPYRIDLRAKKALVPDKTLSKQIFKISFPAMLERICMSSSGIFVTSSIATLGTISIAANSLILTGESLSYMPAFAFQMAITTLVGQCLGAEKPKLAERFVRTTMIMGCIVMLITGGILIVLDEQIIGLFTPDAAVIELGARGLVLMGLIQVPQVAAWILSGVLRGAGDTTINFYISASTNWGVRTLFSVIAIRVWHLDLMAVCYVMMIEIVVRLILLIIRYQGGKWKTIMDKK